MILSPIPSLIHTKTGDFDVIAIDLQQITNSAFSALAPYATGFCGSSIDLSVQQDEYSVTHMSGYKSDEYDALIEAIYSETDATVKAQKMHEAEALLMEDMPVMPVYVAGNYRAVGSDIEDVSYDYFGSAIFTETNDKTFVYQPEEKLRSNSAGLSPP